ncbi:MAG: hypothetical protein ABL898_03570 [Hyphomicrobiaceae bacterium]|nr:hypothetical protein [Hyphomicrobiaceae bacterium]
MVKLPFALLQDGRTTRQTLLIFTLASAIINGLVTASVGAWLAQKYATAQSRRQSINGLSTLLYERRIKAGLVVSSLRRNGELDEIRHRKRGYDETYVDWNKNLRQNLFAIREVMGESEFSHLEQDFEKYVVDPLSRIDSCLTRAYDQKIANQDPLPQLETCRMADLYQLTLDCGASFTNELYKLTSVRLLPFTGATEIDRRAARARIAKACERPTG